MPQETYAEKFEYLGDCVFCRSPLYDGKAESGFIGQGPDLADASGDFGCGANPISNEDGVGGHMTTDKLTALYIFMESEGGFPPAEEPKGNIGLHLRDCLNRLS